MGWRTLALIQQIDQAQNSFELENLYGHRRWKTPVAVVFRPDGWLENLNGCRKRVRNQAGMFVFGDKGRKRSHLLPGMGGRIRRRKQNLILQCSIIIGLGVAVILAALMYWMNRLGP